MHKNDTEKLEAVAHQLPGWVNVVIPGDKILRGMVRSYLAPFQFIVYEITESTPPGPSSSFTSSFARCLWIDRSDRPTRPQRSSGKADVIAALRGREGVFG